VPAVRARLRGAADLSDATVSATAACSRASSSRFNFERGGGGGEIRVGILGLNPIRNAQDAFRTSS
jgi:hypothetical protein